MRRRSMFFMCLAMAFPLIAGEAWYFLPNYGQDVRGVETPRRGEGRFYETVPEPARRLLQPDGGLSFDRREKVAWRRAWFPHSGFARMMPEKNVFGWYGHEFGIPAGLAGLDLWLDLGIVDDADETFVNGVMVGKTGVVPGGSVWQEDRLYRVPSAGLNVYGDNFIAVHVWSLWGLGGIVGPPVLKAAVAPPGAQWNVAFIHDADAPVEGLNDSRTVIGALEAFLTGKELEWREAAMPWKGYADWAEDAHYAVFKLSFDLLLGDGSPRRFNHPCVMDCGPVFDVAAFYLNGRRVGLVGRFPEDDMPAFTEAAQRARFIVEPADWAADGHNELTAVVFRERGVGGLPGAPGILLDNPMTLGGDPSPADYFEAFKILVQSDRLVDASGFLARAGRESMSGLGHAWLLSHKAHAAYLEWLDGGRKDAGLLEGVVASIAETLSKYPMESPKQSAMQAFCQILRMAEKDAAIQSIVQKHFQRFDKNCFMLPSDRIAQGDWQVHYGEDFFALAAMGQICDWTGGKREAKYSLSVPGNRDKPRYWLPQRQRNLTSPSAFLMHLELAMASDKIETITPEGVSPCLFPKLDLRRAAWWNDHGEMHPFDDAGPDMILEMKDLPENYLLSMYFLDYDWRKSLHPRQQSMLVMDETGALLNALWVGKLEDGVYERFSVSGRSLLKIRFNKHRGACVAVSGAFIDEPHVFPELSGSLKGEIEPSLSELYGMLRLSGFQERLPIALQLLRHEKELLNDKAGMLGAFIFASAAEASWTTADVKRAVLDRLKLSDVASILDWLSAMKTIQNHRFIWYYLAAAVIFEKIHDLQPTEANRQIVKLFDLCVNYNVYSIRNVCIRYIEQSKEEGSLELAKELKSRMPVFFKVTPSEHPTEEKAK